MYLQEILEVVIGLIFVWLLLALACMGFQEWLAHIFKWRSKDLEKSIQKILGDREFADDFYKHPLITGLSSVIKIRLPESAGTVKRLYKKIYDWWMQRRAKPSYIPKDTFAKVVFELVMTAGTDTSTLRAILVKAKANFSGVIKSEIKLLINEISEKTYPEALKKLKELIKKYPDLGMNPDVITVLFPPYLDGDEIHDLFMKGVYALAEKNDHFSRLLNSMAAGVEEYLKTGESMIAKARTNFEEYFDQSMDRLVGVYKRKMQWVGLLVGLLMALLFNVDAITISTTLWREPTIRTVFVERASELTETPLPTEVDQKQPQEAWKDFQDQFEGLDIPLGWKTQNVGFPIVPFDQPENGVTWDWWASKIVGWGISGAAAAQGAPFWFDILKQLVNIRSVGTNPNEKKKQENAK